jgi:hypothetical protein
VLRVADLGPHDWSLWDPFNPPASRKIRVRPGPSGKIEQRATVHRPLGRRAAVVTRDRPGGTDDTLTLLVPPDEWEGIVALVGRRSTLVLRTGHGERRYVRVVGDPTVTAIGRSDNLWRHIDVTFVEVPAVPAGSYRALAAMHPTYEALAAAYPTYGHMTAQAGTYAALSAAYPTYEALAAAHATYGDLPAGIG